MTTKILVIRFRRVGDAVISSSLCTSLKQMFPDSEIHYVLNENIAPLFFHHPAIDKVITFADNELSGMPYFKKVRRIVKEVKYDIIVDTRATIKTMPFSLFSLGTKYRIGRKKSYNPLIHNYRVDNKFRGDRDNCELTLSLLDPLGKEFTVRKDPAFRVYSTDKEKADFRQYMQSKGIDFSKSVMLCAVATRIKNKEWPVDKMKEVLSRLLDKYNMQLVFNYAGSEEFKLADDLHKSMNSDQRVFTNIEAKNLRELLAMMSNSNFFFGNEGGPRHISQALDIPSFAIYPPGVDIANWLPGRSEKFRGIELKDIDPVSASNDRLTNQDKFALIDVDSVWLKLDEMLSGIFKQK